MTLDLTDEEAAALTKHLREAIDDARFPLAPRSARRSDPGKLEPPESRNTNRRRR